MQIVAAVVLGLVLAGGTCAEPCARWAQVTAPGRPPGPVSLAYDSARDVCVAYSPFYTGQTWEWDGIAWTQRTTPVAPNAFEGFGLAYDSARQVIVLFGGQGASGYVAETWEWDGNAWMQRAPTVSPSPRGFVAMCFDSGRNVVVLHGGHQPGSDPLADTWEYDGQTWALRTPSGPSTGGRHEHQMVYDSVRGCCVMFGGSMGIDGSTWTYDGAEWTQFSSPSGPPGRRRHSMAFDGERGVVVLFGGRADSGPFLTETLEWNGAEWNAGLAAGPSAREYAGMAYDAVRRVTVLAGGQFLPSYLADTWELANRGAPVVGAAPDPQTVAIGQAAIFAVSATGDPTLTYRWRRNGAPLNNGGNISGALSPTLIINPAALANAGQYDVVVTNLCGSVTSGSALLTVTIPCTGDTNGDFIVNFADLNNVLGNFGTNCQR